MHITDLFPQALTIYSVGFIESAAIRIKSRLKHKNMFTDMYFVVKSVWNSTRCFVPTCIPTPTLWQATDIPPSAPWLAKIAVHASE